MLVLVIGDLHLPHRASDLPSKFRKLLVPGKIQQIVCTGNVCDRETLDYLRTIAGDVHVVRGDWDENPYFPNSLVIHHPPLRIGLLHGHQIMPPGDADSQCALARAMDVDVLVTGHTHRFDAFEREGRFFVNPGSATGAWSSVWPIAEEGQEPGEGEEVGEKDEKSEKSKDAPGTGTSGEDDAADVAEQISKRASTTQSSEQAPQPKDDKEKKQDGKDVESMESKGEDVEKKKTANVVAEGKPITEPRAAPEPTPSFALLDIQGAVIITYVYQLIDGEVKVEKMEFRKAVDADAAEATGMAAQRPVAGTRY